MHIDDISSMNEERKDSGNKDMMFEIRLAGLIGLRSNGDSNYEVHYVYMG